MIWLESFTPKRRFTADSKRSPSCETIDSTAAEQQQRYDLAEAERGKAGRDHEACGKAADGAGPGLVRTDPRPQFRAADAAAGEIAADIGDPHHQQHEHQRGQAHRRVDAHAGSRPVRAAPHRQIRPTAQIRRSGVSAATANEAKRQRDKREFEPSERRRDRRPSPAHATPDGDHAKPARCADDRQPFDIEADRGQRHQQRPTASRRHRRSQSRPAPARRPRAMRMHEVARRLRRRPPPARLRRSRHDPVFAARPPKRRSRLAYSAIAPSSAALSKSGQWIGTNTSSL